MSSGVHDGQGTRRRLGGRRRALRLPPYRAAHVAVIALCALVVLLVGSLQMLFVLGMEPGAPAFITPIAVGTVFGVLIVHIWRHREAEQRIALVLAEREARIRELNQSLEQIAEERGQALRGKERELIGAQKMDAIGRMAGGLAHDFNNLLTCVIGSASLLESKATDDETRALANEILSAGDRAAELTRQLLAVGKNPVTRPEVFDLGAQLEQLVPMMQRVLSDRIGLALIRGESHANILADRGQIEQVVMNLCINARDAIEEAGGEGQITMEVDVTEPGSSASDALVVLRVRDDGAGMDVETTERIFEPFFTTKAEGRGTGLGLSVVYGILRMFGAEVRVHSEVGEGTSFEVSFPLVEGSASERTRGGLPQLVTGGRETVLVVEGDDWVRSLVVAVLRSHGYDVLQTSDADAARALVADHEGTIDLVVSDVMMPGGGGWDLAMDLRRSHPDLRVLLMTGYAGHSVAALDLAEDMLLLEKPFTANALARHVRATLDADPIRELLSAS